MADNASDARAPHRNPLPRTLTALVVAIALIEIFLSLADRGLILDPSLRYRVVAAGGFWVGLLNGEALLFPSQPWTMFASHALLHGGFLHMAMNMAILLALGRFAADHYGGRVVLPLFLAGAVAGGAMFGFIGDPRFPMVGASGAVFAFLGLWIAWDWRRHRALGASLAPVWKRVAVLAGLNAVAFFGLGGMLAWEAHLGGFLVGLAAGYALEPRRMMVATAARVRGAGGDGSP